jgi:predicted nucleic acid-binding protein
MDREDTVAAIETALRAERCKTERIGNYKSLMTALIAGTPPWLARMNAILGLYEFYYSLSRANDNIDQKILRTKEKVFATLPIVPLSDAGGKIFGALKTTYQSKYSLPRTALARDSVDLMIASSALETGSILVSHDQVFLKIQAAQASLQVEDWAV